MIRMAPTIARFRASSTALARDAAALRRVQRPLRDRRAEPHARGEHRGGCGAAVDSAELALLQREDGFRVETQFLTRLLLHGRFPLRQRCAAAMPCTRA